jgi:FKBP-type peptidyl-prolyl cis-trans isomerase FkpA
MNTRWILIGLLSLTAVGAGGCRKRHGGGVRVINASTANPVSDSDKTLYALGLMLGTRIADFSLTPNEIAIVERGLTDQLTNQPKLVQLETWGPRIGRLAEERGRVRAQEAHRLGAAFADRAAAEPGAVRLPSGLVYKEIEPGTGAQPGPQDGVTVHYRGTLIDGTEFDSSIRRNEPASFQLSGVIPCWTEGVARMHVGGRARLVCPPAIAYGERAQRQIPAGSTLNFEVTLISIQPAATPGAGAPANTSTPGH